ncbi:MAG: hypothetical protein JO057_05380 [Chloroflexi bacterium]|nr:hypothetical protein [Chloroflexota bacterium]
MPWQEREASAKPAEALKSRLQNNTLTEEDRRQLLELVERAEQAAESLYDAAVLGW